MKTCTSCGQTAEDDVKFCFKCGGSQFAPNYQQQATNYQQAPCRQGNSEVVPFGEFLKLCLIFLIPIYGFIKMIMVAVGGPKYSAFMTNMMRYSFAMTIAVMIVYIVIFILMAVLGVSLISALN